MSSAKPASGFLGMNASTIRPPAQAIEPKAFSPRKYNLLRQAQAILYDREKADKEQHRTCWCHRGMRGDIANVWRRADGSSARLTGVITCGSVWTCPVCSSKLCASRQTEIQRAMVAWIGRETGNRVFLVTATFPHERDHELVDLLKRQAKALAVFKRSKPYEKIMGKDAGKRLGSIRSLEVTLGEHGWHPHTHDLVFGRMGLFQDAKQLDSGELQHVDIERLKSAWCSALLKAGLCEPHQLSDVMAHGLSVRGGDYAAEYVAKFGRDQKWGLSREVSMHAAKTGADAKGAHPFALLQWAAEGDAQAYAQFAEYADAFTGKRMLSWSPGLKKSLLDEDEVDDEVLIDAPEEESLMGSITPEQFSTLHARRALGEFLEFVARYGGDQEDIDRFIAEQIATRPRAGQGTIKKRIVKTKFAHYDAELHA